ncbi:hypothetical protein phytr_6300 [Candidatus Phycorickettsia trachydisci]|uniref:Uncharacterized protein n=1 Tax=Candidatus Phycorickettsia trachydisci TaxID=2115978 RepID=A0A2P1P8I5_9RICK|nr:hypothetical protein [Candidatus Phycorickettsia trachydisci]AVP87571.1 hypothetical protein phytr_6300 [Candidatus Phycorickettsia trachydisci]
MKILCYILNIFISLTTCYYGYKIKTQKKELQKLAAREKAKKMMAETLSPFKFFTSEISKIPDMLDVFKANSTINTYDFQVQSYGESKEDKKKYVYVESNFLIDANYLDFIKILDEFKKQGLIFSVKTFTLEGKDLTPNVVSVSLITLAYDKM